MKPDDLPIQRAPVNLKSENALGNQSLHARLSEFSAPREGERSAQERGRRSAVLKPAITIIITP
jgi:hypothetical protein